MTTILGIPGSLRAGSFNRKLLAAAAGTLPDDVTLHVWDNLSALPAFDESLEGGPVPAAVAELRAALSGADGVLFATPEYNGSIPGALKNAVDWASRPHGKSSFSGLPAAVIGTSPSPNGAAWAQQELRKVLGIAGGQVLDGHVPVPKAFQQFDEHGRLLDAGIRGDLAALLDALVGEVTEARAA